MRTNRFVARSRLGVPVEELWQWHMRSGAFERLHPPWERIDFGERPAPPAEGGRVELRLRAGVLPVRWVAIHRGIEPGRRFQDVQEKGPFARWCHTHRFAPEGAARSLLEDEIEYAPPLGWLVRRAAGPYLRNRLRRVFAYRHAVTRADLERHRGRAPLRVAVSGAGGLVGSSLVALLESGGHRVLRLVRRPPAAEDEVRYEVNAARIEADPLEGLDALVHLAGENIAARRWSEQQKRRIRDSRVNGTRGLAERLARLKRPPAVMISASAIGFYGDRGDELLDESSGPGSGFLAETCRAWEQALEPAERAGVRAVRLRIGVVLSAAGGALGRMLLPFRLGLGGRIGSGQQFISWISRDDLVGLIHFLLYDTELSGPINAVAPTPVRNAEFTRALARTLGRPAAFPVPGAAIRLVMGEMGRELLLASARVSPRRLERAGFNFRHAALEPALRFELGRMARPDPLPDFEFA